MKIAPSILSADFANLQSDVQRVEALGADLIHIDAMDGQFVPNLTLGANVVAALNKVTNLPLDCHLMIDKPERFIEDFAKAGADMISVHVESTPHLHRVIQQIKEYGIQAGVVINPSTPVEAIKPVLEDVHFVLVMTVNPGFGGQKFITSTLNKIRQLDAIRKSENLSFLIEVDGGINQDTIKLCQQAGVDIAVAGSYIYDAPDMKKAMNALKTVSYE